MLFALFQSRAREEVVRCHTANRSLTVAALFVMTRLIRPLRYVSVPLRQAVLIALISAFHPGCSALIDPNVPERIQRHVEPLGEEPYLLYVPSSYDRTLSWPLVVVCHSSFSDSPNKQIRHWTEQAESRGFLVVAPKIRSTYRALGSSITDHISKLRRDERTVLNAIRHVQGAHHISEDRIFIHGWSGGAYAALYVGLKNPDVFRTVSLLQPRFDSGLNNDIARQIDPYQAVFINYSSSDAIFGKNASACVDWLRDHGANVVDDPFGPSRASSTERIVDFYEDNTRKHAWIRVHLVHADDENRLVVQFKARCSYKPLQYRWQFGDGDESPVAEPIHVYAKPGTYLVTLSIAGPKDRRDSRTFDVSVPQARLSYHRPTAGE